jgi:hypothetical protein
MAGAKQHDDTNLSWLRPWAVRQQGCARGVVLHHIVVLERGATSKAGEEEKPLGP